MEESIALNIGTKKHQKLILIGFITGVVFFALKLCWLPLARAFLGLDIGQENQPATLGFFYRNLFWFPWIGAFILFVIGLPKKNMSKALPFVIGLAGSWVLFFAGMALYLALAG
jgi:hypothetical protein